MRDMRQTLGIVLAAALAAGCAHVPPAAQAEAPAVSIALRTPRPGLYTGGQPAPSDWTAIRARGVRTVINLRPAEELAGRDEAAEVAAAGMRYVAIPVAGGADINAGNAQALRDALAAAPDGAVLLHCASGNRAGGLLALEQALLEGVPPEQALETGRAAGMGSTAARVRELLGLDE